MIDEIIFSIDLLRRRRYLFLLEDSYVALVHYLEGICTVLYIRNKQSCLTFPKWLNRETDGGFFTSVHWSVHMQHSQKDTFKLTLDYFEKYLFYLKDSDVVSLSKNKR